MARLTFNAPSHQSKSHRAWKKKGPEQKVGDVESPPFNYSPDESIEIAEYLDDTTTVTTTTTSTITTTTISAQVSDGTALVPNMKMSEAVYRPSHVKELKTTTLAVAKKLTTTTTTVAAQAGYALKPNAKVAEAVYRPSDVKDTTTTVSTTTKFVPTKPPPTVEPQAGYVLEPYFNLASKLPAQRPKNVTDPTTTTTTTTTRRTTTTTTIEPQAGYAARSPHLRPNMSNESLARRPSAAHWLAHDNLDFEDANESISKTIKYTMNYGYDSKADRKGGLNLLNLKHGIRVHG